MQQVLKRTPRSLAAPPPQFAHGRGLPGVRVPALLTLAGLVALGWHAQHSTAVPRVHLMLEPAAIAQPQVAVASAAPILSPRNVAPVKRSVPLVAEHPRHRSVRVWTKAEGRRVGRATGAPRHKKRPATRIERAIPIVVALPPARQRILTAPFGPGQRSLLPAVSAEGDLQRRALAPNPSARIMALPSMSVLAIRQELRQGHSPLLLESWTDGKDAAQYIWDAGRVLGVDPAVLMAFFWHESQYGVRGMARLTYSVGNIRPLDGQPELNGYRFYRTWAQSVDDTYRLLRRYVRHGLGDVAHAVPVWAPSSDNNDVQAYVGDVESTMAHYYAISVTGDSASAAQMIASR